VKTIGLEIILDYMRLSAVDAWNMSKVTHPELFLPDIGCDLSGKDMKVQDVESAIRRGRKPHFGIRCQDGVLDYSQVGGYDHALLQVLGFAEDVHDAETWCSPFLSEPSFRMARVYDEYDDWQNAEDTLEYEAKGRRYDDLPMKSNGLPFPLEQMVIDTSRNPGRRLLRKGYVEAVGSTMWLGESFWALTGTQKSQVLKQDWLCSEERPHGVLRIQAWDRPFVEDQGESGRVQERLRKVLFPAL
jgi:hypothetical protein